MIRFLLFLLLIFSGSLTCFAQRETDNWYFGQNASLEFNASGTPVSFLNSAMNAPAGCSSISDKAGNLLFYTDGETVWNRLHQVMQNGNGLSGSKLASQSSIIIPNPGNKNEYYIITQEHIMISGFGFQATKMIYSVVDISALNGFGEVKAANKNIPFYITPANMFLSQKLTAVHHANNQEVWLITHRFVNYQNFEFLAFKITATGIQTTPVTSQLPFQATSLQGIGVLKADPTGKWLAGNFIGDLILYQFNNFNGIVANPITLNPNSVGMGPIEFSPDGTKLYAVLNNPIDQFNLSSGIPATIIASRIQISNNPGIYVFRGLQLASDGKIYAGQENQISISEIANPNVAGTGCNFRTRVVLPAGRYMRGAFPNFIQSYFAPPRFNYTGICAEIPVNFTIPNQANIDSVKWNFGDPTSGTDNISSQLQPNHIFALPGIFTVQLTVYQQGFQSVFERDLTIMNKPKVQLPEDTSLCEGTTLNLVNMYPPNPFNERWLWSTGNTDSTMLKVKKPGIYWLELTNGVCTTRDSIVVQFRPVPKADLGADRIQCGNAAVILDAGNPGATYLWQPNGETSQTIAVTKPGVYSVTITSNRCSDTDAVNVNINNIPGFEFGDDITVCEGEQVILKTVEKVPGVFYSWSDSSRWPELEVKKSGKYWATVNQNGCIFTDTINVTFKSCPPPIIPYIPNIISPNNDNRNDKFVIEKIPLDSWALKIYNRWGKLIYSNDRYSNNWPEKPIINGTYYYLLEEPETGRKFKGWLEVIQ